MKFGACIGTDAKKLEILKELGFDYAESGCGAISGLTDEEFEAFLAAKERIGLPMIAANGFFPKNIKLTGPESDPEQIKAYLEKLISRAGKLGIKSFIFGSGGAREIPESLTIEQGREKLVEVVKTIICPMAAQKGIRIVIEPLRTEECNILNTVHEGVEFMAKAGCDNLFVLADVYHMVCMAEPFDYLAGLSGKLVHAHTSNPVGGNTRRVYPTVNDEFDQVPFLKNLAAAGCEYCSLEAGTGDDYRADAKAALECLRAAEVKI